MRLRQRVSKLEGNRSGVSVVIDPRNLSEAESARAAEDYRRTNGLPPDAPVIVISDDDAEA